MAARKRKPRKQSGRRASSTAARLLAADKALDGDGRFIFVSESTLRDIHVAGFVVSDVTAQVKTVAASCLSQDEVKGA